MQGRVCHFSVCTGLPGDPGRAGVHLLAHEPPAAKKYCHHCHGGPHAAGHRHDVLQEHCLLPLGPASSHTHKERLHLQPQVCAAPSGCIIVRALPYPQKERLRLQPKVCAGPSGCIIVHAPVRAHKDSQRHVFALSVLLAVSTYMLHHTVTKRVHLHLEVCVVPYLCFWLCCVYVYVIDVLCAQQEGLHLQRDASAVA